MIPYYGDFAEDSTIYIPFNTFSSDDPSASITITNLADADIKVHKDGGLTQIATDGATIAIDYDGITGNHLITVDTSVHADYSTGSDYQVRIEGTTVDAATINAFVGTFSIENRYNAAADDLANVTDGLGALRTLLLDIPTVSEFNARTLAAANYFDPATDAVANVTLTATTTTVTNQVTANMTSISGDTTAADNLEAMYDGTGYTDDVAPATQSQVGSLSVGSGGVSTTASSFVATTAGTPTNSVTDTVSEDLVYHIVPPTGGALDFYYEFNVGGSGIIQSIEWDGYVQSNNDNCEVYFYNWAGAAFEQVGTIPGATGTTPVSLQFVATIAHVGTGADLGLVRFRFASDGGDVVTNVATDRILATYTFSNQSIGYEGGAVWLDTNKSNTGTESFVDGTADNPVSTITAARTILDNLNLRFLQIEPGSSVTLSQGWDGYEFLGISYDLNLGSQACPNTYIKGANIQASTVTGSGIIFDSCIFDANVTLPPCIVRMSFLGNATITAGSAGDYFINNCIDRATGILTPTFDFAAVGSTTFNVQDYSGGIEVSNMGGSGTDAAVVSGNARLIGNANCTAGTITLLGEVSVIDNSGNLTFSQAANTINKLLDIQGATFSTSTDSLEALRNRGDAAWVTGAGGTPPQLLQSTTIATLASQTSFTLTAGSGDNDAYNDAIAVITDSSSSVQKAVGTVSDYVGSTRTVTLSADPGIFTMAVGDTVDIIAALGSSSGGGGATAVDVRIEMDANSTQLAAIVEDTGTTLPATLATIDTVVDGIQTDLSNATDGLGAIKADTAAILTDTGTTLPASIATVDSNVDAILVDTGTTLPASIATVDSNVDAVLVDTGTTIPGLLTTIDTVVDGIQTDLDNGTDGLGAIKADTAAVLTDTGTTLPASIATVDSNVDAILVDTGTTLPATLATIDTVVDGIQTDLSNGTDGLGAIKADTAAVLTDTGTTLPALLPTSLSPNGNMDVNIVEIKDSLTTANAFERAVRTNVIGTVGVGSTTTSIVTSSVLPVGGAEDQFQPRYLVFADNTTTVSLRGQATDITAVTAAAAPTLTVTALSTAPVSGDTFVIL